MLECVLNGRWTESAIGGVARSNLKGLGVKKKSCEKKWEELAVFQMFGEGKEGPGRVKAVVLQAKARS